MPEHALGVGEVIRLSWRDVRQTLPEMLKFELIFQGLGLVLLSPAMALLFRAFVSSSGDRAVGNFDIATFLLSPIGITAILGLGALALAIRLAGISGLMVIGHGASHGRLVPAGAAFGVVYRHLRRILAVSFLGLLAILGSMLPFALGIVVTARRLLTEHDINYYLDARPTELREVLAVAALLGSGGLLVGTFTFLAVSFALPDVLFTDESVRRSFSRSRAFVRLELGAVAKPILGWLGLWLGGSALIGVLLHACGRLVISALPARPGLLMLVLGLFAVGNAVISFLIVFVGIAVGSVLVVRLFLDIARRAAPDLVFQVPRGEELGTRSAWGVGRRTPLVLLVVALLAAGGVGYGLVESAQFDDRIDITAHRGSSIAAPENTLAAFERAVLDGATVVELDVQLTADGHVVVAHDADLMRVGGSPLVVTASTLEGLRQVDIGAKHGAEFAGQRVPTLDEAIDVVQGRVKLDVEIKSYAADGKRLVEEVVGILRQRGMAGQSMIMSLKLEELKEAKRLAPEIPAGFVASASLGDITRLGADFLAASASMATHTFVASAHTAGQEVWVWTIDEPALMWTMIDRGVDNIITNVPEEVLGVLEERAELTNTERLLLRFKSIYVD